VVATGSSEFGLGISDFGLNDTTSALNQQSDIRDLQSNDPVATARGSDTLACIKKGGNMCGLAI